YSFDRVGESLERRLHLVPSFRRRLVTVPLQLHHPVWIEDPDFDLHAHLHRAVLPAPGGHQELDDVMSEIVSTPLDRSRPLWELWVVEGLAGGHVAFVAKIHHCLADGVKAAELLATVLDDRPDAPEPETQRWHPEPMPSRRRLLVDALVDLVREIGRLPNLLVRTFRGLRAAGKARKERAVSPPLPFNTPKLSFNTALTPHRRFVTTTLSLSDVKAVKSALGCTVNDVVLELCAGSLRLHLAERGELPDRALLAGVPTSTRQAAPSRDRSGAGNQVSNLFTTLPVQLADPGTRLELIHETTKGAKEQLNLLGADMLADWSEITPPRPFAALVGLYSHFGLARRHRPPINLVVSNVPGPAEPLYISGARLLALYSMGPILENIGLNVTVWSYLDTLNFGIVACDDTLPGALADRLPDALAELQKVVAARA
ncbi:MAG: wax ester/triacylglycerol synthase family O-acyltransferase, partial [Actinobacteria bacterium]|nr:wax ester/triacylglycerol synthase family O-acyltransferase [Actinomycetota bacterium]